MSPDASRNWVACFTTDTGRLSREPKFRFGPAPKDRQTFSKGQNFISKREGESMGVGTHGSDCLLSIRISASEEMEQFCSQFAVSGFCLHMLLQGNPGSNSIMGRDLCWQHKSREGEGRIYAQ